MKIEIKSRYDASVLFAVEIGSWKLALEAAVASRADLRGANLVGANLRRADLRRANLEGANLRRANLEGADLRRANLVGANLEGADLRRANLEGADLRRANLEGANLRRANLRRANLVGADLRRADLVGANLVGADLRRANLRRADLRRANLRRANLVGADLVGANLRGANFRGANLVGANLEGAKHLNAYRVTPLLMLLDQPGPIWAYKLVTAAMVGPFNGGITYTIGQEYAVPNADTDPAIACAVGINLATLDWCMREWQSGYRILVAEFFAADIAAIPTATDGKFRVRRCRIVGEKDLVEIGLKEPAS